MAVLKRNIDSVKFETLELQAAVIYSKEKFLTYRETWDSEKWPVWTNKGEFGHIDSGYILTLPDEPVFKMATDTQTLFRIACYQRSINKFRAKGNNIDICELTKLAANHDHEAFEKICEFIEFPDIASGGHYGSATDLLLSSIVWDVLHLYEDEEFKIFLCSMDRKLKKSVAKYITSPWVGWPINDKRSYFKSHYPETWRLIKWHRNKQRPKVIPTSYGRTEIMIKD